LSPGLRFFHQGQFQGRKKRISPHLCRGPDEPINQALEQFYDRLLAVLRHPAVRQGNWQLLACLPAWDGNWTWECFLAFAWHDPGGERWLVAVNYAANQSQCYVPLPFPDLSDCAVRLKDLMSPTSYDRDGTDLVSRGLYLDMPAWSYHVFEVLRLA
jgi:hypothetical protein